MVWNEGNLIRKTALTVKLPRGVVFFPFSYCCLLHGVIMLSFLSELRMSIYSNEFHLSVHVRGKIKEHFDELETTEFQNFGV